MKRNREDIILNDLYGFVDHGHPLGAVRLALDAVDQSVELRMLEVTVVPVPGSTWLRL